MTKEFVINGVDQKPVPEDFKIAFKAMRDHRKKLEDDGMLEPEVTIKVAEWIKENKMSDL